ncbi:cysteine-rich receptor-like protein kinase 44 isoform X2 [Rhododendron vialii]|uniref:cysteine-rich receptor-like protein kinase 44 isoform X2 n=1 Tax=Rhododendron vialii TaxID=182163 RepID=UPI00265FC2FF|nr:cysteine-rich receptor-like protein kinase 44 isoform X2 [Rhododendron vialii]
MATMGSWREFLFLHLILVNIESTLELGLWSDLTYFDTGSGNYSTNSTYQTNLNTLLSSLSSRTDGYGFYSSSFGDNPDKVYAIVLCRGDVELVTCRSCINNSTINLPQLLPNSKGAIGWYEQCMLRYSNKSMNGIKATHPYQVLYSGVNASSMEEFKQARGILLGDLRDKAASGGDLSKFATGQKITGPDYVQTIYGLMQCTPDLSKMDCNNCLQWAAREITQLGAPTGWRILAPSCTLRYELNLFYNDTPPATSAPPPAPPPARTFAPPPPSANYVTTKQGKKDNTTRTVIIVVLTIILVIGLIVYICVFLRKRKQKKKPKQEVEVGDKISIVELSQYEFETISVATDNFSASNKLGQGGFGAVYKGRLLNGQEIAVKRLAKESLQGEIEFKNEVMLLAKLQHRNLVRLLGFCSERTERLLIYELVPQSSLDHFIFNPTRHKELGWDRRYKIILGVSRGLLYLHEESQLRIIHRDLKASNVLLDDDMNPKISDFGMARLFMVDESHWSTINIAGTCGYMAPEYVLHGQFSVKSDVFSFGVLVLEILSGQKNKFFCNEENIEGLLSYAWKTWREGTNSNLIDPALRVNSGSLPEMIRCIHIGLLCVQENVAKRPTMAEVVLMLSSSSLSLKVPSEPGFFLHSGSNNAKLPLLQENRSELAVSDHSINEVSTTELYPR